MAIVVNQYYSSIPYGNTRTYIKFLISIFYILVYYVSQVSNGVEWKPIGIQNLGTICYLNSILHCLFTIDYSSCKY